MRSNAILVNRAYPKLVLLIDLYLWRQEVRRRNDIVDSPQTQNVRIYRVWAPS